SARFAWSDRRALRHRRRGGGGRGRFGSGACSCSNTAGNEGRAADGAEVVTSMCPLFAVLAPAIGALLIASTGERRANLREFWSVAAGVLQAAVVIAIILAVLAVRTPECVLLRVLRGTHAGL